MPTLPPSLDTVFCEAIEIPDPAARDAYLARACGPDAALRRWVGALVAAHFRAGNFLDQPAEPPDETASFLAAAGGPEGPERVIGPYTLREQIGEGGMGLVFVAEQTHPVRRRVALKVIKPGMDTRQVVARFEAERQALALMDHPNIAKVHDGGTTPDGRPFFVMELVKGEPVTEYCDRHRLALRDRLWLFVQVCRAVQHAHQRGVIHRDLKPSNVLVTVHDVTAVAKVIDFGIAKAVGQTLTEKTVYTAFTQMVGTPLYMSPEQAGESGLDVDTRTDVYSLGVLLYELLTGTTPIDPETFRKAGHDEVRRLIREDEPARPSARLSTLNAAALSTVAGSQGADPRRLARQLRGELDWVVMKCLEKDRNRRYESASALTSDVERYLADEPVEACPPSTGYRLRKYSRRNKVALVTMGMVAAALLVGTAVSTWQAVRATRAEGFAQERLNAEKEAREEADANLGKAREAGEEFFTRVSENRLLDQPGLQSLRKELLEAAVTYYERLARRHSDDPKGRTDLALASMRLSEIYFQIGFLDRHVAALERGLDLVDTLLLSHPDAASEHLRLAGLWHGGRMLVARPPYTDRNQALRVFQRAGALWERLAGQYADATGFQSDLSKFYDQQASVQLELGRPAEALIIQQKIRQLREEVVRSNPGVYAHVPELAHTYVELAKLLESTDPRAAEVLHRRAVTLQKNASDVPSHQEFLASHQVVLGAFLRRQNRPGEAAQAVQHAIDIHNKLAVRFPHISHYKATAAAWRVDFGGFGPLKDPADSLQTTLRDAQAFAARGGANERRERFDAAVADYHRAVDLDPENAEYHYRLGGLYIYRADGVRRDPNRGAAHVQRSLELRPEYYHCHAALAAAHVRLGDPQKARMHLEKFAERAPRTAETSYVLAGLHSDLGDLPAAVVHARNGVAVDPADPWIHHRLATLLNAQGKLRESLEEVNRAIEVNTKPQDPSTFHFLETRGHLYWSLGQNAEAMADWDRLIRIVPARHVAYKHRGLAHFRSKNYTQALADIIKGMELNWNDLSGLTWIAPDAVAACQDPDFRQGIFELADRAIQHTDTRADAFAGRASLNAAHQRHPEAEADYAKAAELDPASSLHLSALGDYLLTRKKFVQAEAALRKCLALRETREPDSWATFDARSMLGGALLGQKKYAQAEPFLLTGFEGVKASKAAIPPGNARLSAAGERIVELYVATNRPEKAKEWRERVRREVGLPPRETAPK